MVPRVNPRLFRAQGHVINSLIDNVQLINIQLTKRKHARKWDLNSGGEGNNFLGHQFCPIILKNRDMYLTKCPMISQFGFVLIFANKEKICRRKPLLSQVRCVS